MKARNSSQPLVLRWLLIFTLIAALVVTAVAVAENSTREPETQFALQWTSTQETQSREELSSREMAQQNLPSIVSISTEAITTLPDYGSYFSPFGGYGYGRQTPREYRSVGAGSGIIISEDGYILTNSHVVSGATSVQVTLSDDTTYDAVVVGADADNDVAVLKINAKGLTPAVFGDSDALMVGDTAMVIGNPLGEVNGSASMGIISALPRTMEIDGKEMMLLQTDAAINPGNSGGALINSYGEVVGIVTAKTASVQVEGIGYAIPINHVRDRIEELVNEPIPEQSEAQQASGSGDSAEMRLGVSVYNVTPERAKQYNLPEGIYVQDVEAGSAADQAGIKAGDVIVSLAGEETLTYAQLEEVKKTLTPGEEQSIVVIRNGDRVELDIILGTIPSV